MADGFLVRLIPEHVYDAIDFQFCAFPQGYLLLLMLFVMPYFLSRSGTVKDLIHNLMSETENKIVSLLSILKPFIVKS